MAAMVKWRDRLCCLKFETQRCSRPSLVKLCCRLVQISGSLCAKWSKTATARNANLNTYLASRAGTARLIDLICKNAS